MNKNVTKKSFLMSIISLLVCVSMLIGTTLAWFTDTVTSGVNKIVAGNLDIEVEYVTEFNPDGTPKTWASIQDVSTLFDPDTLWEPGHTEEVYLRISNKGSLAFNYMLNVSPITETTGINVNGDTFKLSDYLVFKTTDPVTTPINKYTRNEARDTAGTIQSLNQAALTKTGSIDKDGADEYIALIVYMPEEVGNEANYLTGTVPPQIELGVTVLATQKAQESDSFGDDYDSGADLTPDFEYSDALTYVTITQVNVSANVTVDGNKKTTAETTVSKTEGGETIAQAILPSGVQMEDGVLAATLIIEKDTGSPSLHVTAGNDEVSIPLNIKVEGVSSANTTPITVSYYIGKNLTGVKIYHKGVLISSAYNPTTGMVTFETDTFSPFTVLFDKPIVSVYPAGITAEDFPEGKYIVDARGRFYVDVKTAINDGASTLYAKENANLKVAASGTNRSDAIRADLTLYGNGANFQDGEIQIWAEASFPSVININIYNTKNLAVWGAPTAYGKTYNVTFAKCTNTWQFLMFRSDGISTDVINANLINCNMTGNGIEHENAIHTTTIGSVTVIGCMFNNVSVPINIALKQAGTMTVNVRNNEFIKCGRLDPLNDYHAPVRLVNSGSDNSLTANVIDNVFVATKGTNGDVHLGDYRSGKSSNPFTAFVKSKGDTDVYVNYMITTLTDGESGNFTYETPDENVVILTPDTFNAAALATDKTIILLPGEYRMPSSDTSANITIKGTYHAVIDVTRGAYLDNAKLTFEGVGFKCSTGYVMSDSGAQGSDYAALYSANIDYINCRFNGGFRVGRNGARFIDCTFDTTAKSNTGVGYVWNYGHDVTFENCTFNTDGKALLIYSDGGSRIATVSVTGTTFNANKGDKAGAIANQNCAAIEIDNYGCGLNLTVSDNTIDDDFSGEWRIKSYNNNGNTITVNGTLYSTLALDGRIMRKEGSNVYFED